MKSRSVEATKIGINSPSERRTETMNATFASTNVDERRYRANKFSNEKNQSVRTFKLIKNSNSNEGMNATNEENVTNRPPKNPRSKINRTNIVSRSPEEKNERTFILRMAGASPCTEIKKEKRKFFSRLPIRTWKRLRTKGPAALRLESDVTNGNDNRKLDVKNIAITKSNDHLEEIKNVPEEIRSINATANHVDVKKRNRFKIGSLSADKPKITSSNIKGLKDLRTTNEQRKKRMIAK